MGSKLLYPPRTKLHSSFLEVCFTPGNKISERTNKLADKEVQWYRAFGRGQEDYQDKTLADHLNPFSENTFLARLERSQYTTKVVRKFREILTIFGHEKRRSMMQCFVLSVLDPSQTF